MQQPSTHVLLRIRPSLPDPEEVSAGRGPLMMEAALAALHSLRGADAHVSLEVGVDDGKICFFVRATPKASAIIESQLYAQYPDAEIEEVTDDPFLPQSKEIVVGCALTLAEPEVFPIKRHPQFEDLIRRQSIDPMAGITATLVRYPKAGMRGHVCIAFRPIGKSYRRRALKFLPLLTRGLAGRWTAFGKFFTRIHLARGLWRWILLPIDLLLGGFRTWLPSRGTSVSFITGETTEEEDLREPGKISARTHDREDPISAAVDKVNHLLFTTEIQVTVFAPAGAEESAAGKVHEIAGSFRQFSLPQCNGFKETGVRTGTVPSRKFILSVEEIATLWHLPNILVKTPNIDWVVSRKLEPPMNLPIAGGDESSITVLGEAVFHGKRTRFGIRGDDRRRHIYLIGKTGMGKSTIIENMLAADIAMGRGVALIDPHGDLVDAVLQHIPKERSNDVVLFEPGDREFPISFNIFECADPAQRPLVASGLMSVFTKLWPDVWSGRMEHILRNTLLALLECEGTSMLGILRMFGDEAFRNKIVGTVVDPMVKSFWEVEFAGWSAQYRTEAVAAIQNKVGQLLSIPMIRNIVGQVRSSLDIRHAMDTGKIILVNLSKGKLGEDTSAFLGSLLVTKFQLDAMSRADLPESERRDFFLYVDEFQNFATESFATILSEARKYRLSLTMANQYVSQLLIGDRSTALRDAVFGNVGSLVSFQVGPDDAEELSVQFEEAVTPKDLLSLPKYHAYLRLLIDGVPTKPFSMATLPPPKVTKDEKRIAQLRKLSRERYAQPRKEVEEKIARWAHSAQEAALGARGKEKQKEKTDEEKKKAKAKGMSLDEYRAWRDREMWLNEFNGLRKRSLLGEELSVLDKTKMDSLQKSLEKTGGMPEPSKTLLDEVRKKNESQTKK